MVTRGSYEEPEVVEVREVAAGKVCSSFQAEMVAIEAALGWLRENEGNGGEREWYQIASPA